MGSIAADADNTREWRMLEQREDDAFIVDGVIVELFVHVCLVPHQSSGSFTPVNARSDLPVYTFNPHSMKNLVRKRLN